jgi:hypothetical protein
MVELMLYSDGELDGERARRIRVARLHHPEVIRRLEGIERVGDFVRVWATTDGVDAAEQRRRALRTIERRRTIGMIAVALAAFAVVAEPVAPETALALAPGHAVAIESVDFGAQRGTVFVVETGESVTPVVWLEDG